MIEKILGDTEFINTMQKHCYEVLKRLLDVEVEFCIIADSNFVDYAPPLPDDLNPSKNHPFVMFILAGYTFESAELYKDKITFHAGFGPNDFATFVTVDLGAIRQIQVENNNIFVNFSLYDKLDEAKLTRQSMNIFLKHSKKDD